MAADGALQRRIERARTEVSARQKLKPAALLMTLARAAPKAVGLESALRRAEAPVVLAGLWRRTPERLLDRDLDVGAAVRACDGAGAAAIAISTESAPFGAVVDDFPRARATTRLPLVRREVVVDPYQLAEARIAGASAGWLVEEALSGRELAKLLGAARDLGLEVVVEVASDTGLERTLDAGAAVVLASARPEATEREAEALARMGRFVARAVAAGALPIVAGVDDPALRAGLEEAGASVFLIDAPLVLADDRRVALEAWRAGRSTPGTDTGCR